MSQLRAYLLSKRPLEEWDVSVHRDLDGLREASVAAIEGGSTAIIHVGFWRPDTASFDDMIKVWRNVVLVTAAARYALPDEYEVAPKPVAQIKGIPIYVAISGWGYNNPDATLSVERANVGDPEPHGDILPDSNDWFENLAHKQPDVWQEARRFGISDETSYGQSEASLPPLLRHQLGTSRFSYYAGESPHPDTILDNLKYGPPWLLRLPIAALQLSRRPLNCLGAAAAETMADLAMIGAAKVRKLPNLGAKSYKEICESVTQLLDAGPDSAVVEAYSSIAKACSIAEGESEGSENNRRTANDDSKSHAEPLPSIAALSGASTVSSIGGLFELALGLADPNRVDLMKLRMGFNGPPKTLQEIGDIYSVSRERIRQIEQKNVNKMRAIPAWREMVEGRLQILLRDRVDPLPLVGLEVLDPWFHGVGELEYAFEYALSAFCDSRFSLVRIDQEVFVSALDQEGWDQALREARKILEAEVDSGITEETASALVTGVLNEEGAELRPMLWAAASRWAHFAKSPSGESLLISFGFGLEHLVEAVLADSERPLHYSEIAERCSDRKGGQPVDVRRVQASAANVGLLFGRGTYGLDKHIGLTDTERLSLISETEDIIEGGRAGRQWHARELTEKLYELGFEMGGKLDHYLLSIVLRDSHRLVYLGRLMWTARAGGMSSAANRIEINQAIAALLQKEGRPMSTHEIRRRIARERGLSPLFQIHPTDSVIRVAAGVWGLADRDSPFPAEVAKRVEEALIASLQERGKALHATEIARAIEGSVPEASDVRDPTAFLAIVQSGSSMRVSKGQYVQLSDWEGPRRLTIPEAVRRALTEAGTAGLTIEEGIQATEAWCERGVDRSSFTHACIQSGAVFSRTDLKWRLYAEDNGRQTESAEEGEAA